MIVRHRTTLRTARAGWALALVLAAVATLGAWLGLRPAGLTGCSGAVQLSVAATPELAPAIRNAAARWSDTGPGHCVSVLVTAAAPADVAAAVAGPQSARSSGLGPPDGHTRVPDVWIPDSSIWLQRLRPVRADLVPATAPSLGTSPVVLAMPEPVATSLGWFGARLTWPVLLQQLATDKQLHAGIAEPDRDATATSALLALDGVVSALGTDGKKMGVDAIRAFDAGWAQVPATLVVRFPAALGLAPLSEQAVLAYNANHPGVRLAALSLDPAPTALDYPYVVLPRLPADRADAAGKLLSALTDSAFRTDLDRAWIRPPDGSAGPDFPASRAMFVPPGAVPDLGAITDVLSNWNEITRKARMLAVIDVSGSMLTPVPTAGGATREQVAVAAAKGGLALFDDSWEVGLWVFSAGLDAGKDYQQLVPIGPLTSQRDRLNAALDTIQPRRSGATGLYDTILAGYQTVQRDWDPGRGNSVVVITDGKNDDPAGLTRDQLLAQLREVADPQRPIQVILIGIGTDVTEADLSPIPQVTGGAAYVAADPAQIGDIFTRALTLHPGN